MAKVTLYKAADGSLHDTPKKCSTHDVGLRILAAASELVFNDQAAGVDDRDNACVYMDLMPQFIASNQVILRKLLNDAQVAKRPRKAKIERTSGPTA